MFLLYHAYVYLEFLILACTIYILAPILRNDNGKWYAVFMNLEGFKIGLDTKDRVDIMVVKCKPDMISVMTHMKGFLPGYYMDKSNWMTILLQQRIL